MRWGAAALALLGLLVMLGAAVVAGLVGSDDTIVTEPARIGGDGRPVLTAPELLAYEGVSITLRAWAPEGVFVATAHPVDVADFVGDTSRVRLDSVTSTGVRSEELGSGPPVDPASADFWTHSLSGPETAELTLVRDSAAAQWVIAPLAGEGPTTITFAVTRPGLFRTALGCLAAGVLLLLVAVEVLLRSRPTRRRRRRGSHTGSHTSGPPSAAERIAAFVPNHQRPVGGSRKLTRSGVVVTVLALALSGCTPADLLPAQRAAGALATSKVALAHTEVPELFASYRARLARAVKAASPPHYREGRWRLADQGPALASDRFGTRVARLTGLGRQSVPNHRGLTAYSPRFEAYPMWSLVASKASGQTRIDLFTRESVMSPWLRAGGSALTELPDGVLPDAGRPRQAADSDAAAAATVAWRDYLTSGERDDRLGLDSGSRTWRENIADLGARAMFRSASVTVEPAGRTNVSRVVSIADGALALVVLDVTTRLVGRPDLRVGWAPPYAKYRASRGGVLALRNLAVGVVHLPEQGAPQLLGSSFSEVPVGR